MKTFLKIVEKFQEEFIERFNEPNLSGEIAGVEISKPESSTILFSSYKDTAQKIYGLLRDRRRFKNDPNKIVIEKNYFFNSLKINGGYFLFMPQEDSGLTAISLPRKYNQTITVPKERKINLIVYLAILLVLTASGIMINRFCLLGFLIMPFILWYDRKIRKESAAEMKGWEIYINQGESLLSAQPYSGTSGGHNVIDCAINIALFECPFQVNYEKMMNKVVPLANKMKGKIAWLWRYDSLPVLAAPDRFSCLYKQWNGPNYCDGFNINIHVRSSTILPVIETQNSFIFILDDFSKEMEDLHRPLYESQALRLASLSETIGKLNKKGDYMFKMHRR